MPARQRYAAGTVVQPRTSPEAALLSDSLAWLIDQRNSDGTWGGDDSLDVLISTNHVAMTLLAVGFSPESDLLIPTLKYLSELDTDRHVSFFWRAGVLLNVPGYETHVREDMEYIWKNKGRIGAHKDYPIPFFLLKLMRFSDPPAELSFEIRDVVRWIVDEWDPQEAWYGRTSITSMALALVGDLRFGKKSAVIDSALNSLTGAFVRDEVGGHFHENVVDDCFTVYNLCETAYITTRRGTVLHDDVSAVVERIVASSTDARWGSAPPFGGNIGTEIYPTAVAVRALLSYWALQAPLLINETAALVAGHAYARPRAPIPQIEPFWGPVDLAVEPMCFVLMPFEPPNLTEVYRRFVKPTIEDATSLTVRRADDFYRPRTIMSDIWTSINRARLIVADLTYKNANVFYELGLAHSLGKNVILLAQSEDDIPFDLRGVRTIIYADTLSGYDYLQEQLRKFLAQL